MAYEKQTWVDGTSPLNAERMNHMEDGIAAADFVIDTKDCIALNDGCTALILNTGLSIADFIKLKLVYSDDGYCVSFPSVLGGENYITLQSFYYEDNINCEERLYYPDTGIMFLSGLSYEDYFSDGKPVVHIDPLNTSGFKIKANLTADDFRNMKFKIDTTDYEFADYNEYDSTYYRITIINKSEARYLYYNPTSGIISCIIDSGK